jgi:thiosulfate/3-mercaptopyruvate sulfurtransferase
MDFKIGRNPLKSDTRPYDFVVLRHIPIAPDSYRDYVSGALVDFATIPTWKYATPHNVQRRTPQTADCTSSCHGNKEVFLTATDLVGLAPEEIAANQGVVVEVIP